MLSSRLAPDAIIAGMLAHARGQSGERRPIVVNGLVHESVILACHEMRTQDGTFDAAMDLPGHSMPCRKTPFSSTWRATLSLQCGRAAAGDYPALKVATHELSDRVKVRLRDSGMGVPKDLHDCIFDPLHHQGRRQAHGPRADHQLCNRGR
jgi:hypothetical protein